MNENQMEGAQDFVDEHSQDKDERIEELEDELERTNKAMRLMRERIFEIGSLMLATAKEVDDLNRK